MPRWGDRPERLIGENSVTIYVWGKPQGKERARKGIRGWYTPSKTSNFQKALGLEATKVLSGKKKPYFNRLDELHSDCFFAFRKPKKSGFKFPIKQDLDNLEKSMWDALNGIVYPDDKQIASSFKCKQYAVDGIEYARITIRRVTS